MVTHKNLQRNRTKCCYPLSSCNLMTSYDLIWRKYSILCFCKKVKEFNLFLEFFVKNIVFYQNVLYNSLILFKGNLQERRCLMSSFDLIWRLILLLLFSNYNNNSHDTEDQKQSIEEYCNCSSIFYKKIELNVATHLVLCHIKFFRLT